MRSAEEDMLVTRELRKAYGKHEVLKGVNLTVKKGEIKGLIGVNGVGKTTLIECICGIKKIDGGEIVMDGRNLSDRKAQKEIKRYFGYMPQSFGMMNDLTVRISRGEEQHNAHKLKIIHKILHKIG